MAVVDDEGNELPDGQEGEIAVRTGPRRPVGLFDEYWRSPEDNAKAFRGDWYYTGDRATRDEDGYFWFIGRADDVIISASYRIGPFEVESALLGVCPRIRSWRRKPPRNNLLTVIWTLSWSNQHLYTSLMTHIA